MTMISCDLIDYYYYFWPNCMLLPSQYFASVTASNELIPILVSQSVSYTLLRLIISLGSSFFLFGVFNLYGQLMVVKVFFTRLVSLLVVVDLTFFLI